MSRDDGFAVADMDSGYFDDAKMRDLWQRLRDPDRMARAVCLHSATLLASWRQGERISVDRAIPLWLPADADLVAALKVAHLLDRFGKIPADSWQTWFGTAYNRRETRRVSGRAGGLVSAQNRALPGEKPPKHAQHRLTDAAPTLEQPSSLAEPVRPSVPTVRPPVAAPAREAEPALDAYQAIMINVSTEALRFLDDLVEAHGQEATAKAIGEASLKGKDKLLSRAKSLLVIRERQADKDEAQAERERLAAKRAPLKREVPTDETPEQAEKREAAYQKMRQQMAGIVGISRISEAHRD